MQVVRGMTFVYLPPPRRKVPYAAAIASAPLPRCVMRIPSSTRTAAELLAALHETFCRIRHPCSLLRANPLMLCCFGAAHTRDPEQLQDEVWSLLSLTIVTHMLQVDGRRL